MRDSTVNSDSKSDICCSRCGRAVQFSLSPQLAGAKGPLCPECQLDEIPFQGIKSLLYNDLAELFRYYR